MNYAFDGFYIYFMAPTAVQSLSKRLGTMRTKLLLYDRLVAAEVFLIIQWESGARSLE